VQIKSELRGGEYVLISDRARMDEQSIYSFLITTYWGKELSIEALRRSLDQSICFGIFHEHRQVAFCRVFTDYVAIAYLFDVYVLESHRGKGLAKWMVETAVNDDRVSRVRRWLLVTRDAHPLYEKVGFRRLTDPERYMEKVRESS
jgi:GNAT superfamily N-acetyltransferase